MKLERPDKQLLYGVLLGITLSIAVVMGSIFILYRDFRDTFPLSTIAPEFTATPGLYLTAIPQTVSQQVIEDRLGAPLPDEMLSFQAVRVCFIDCDYGVRFSASPEAVESFVKGLDHITVEDGRNPFDVENDFVFVGLLDWWTPETAHQFSGSAPGFWPQIFVDKSNPEGYTVNLTFFVG